MLVFLVLSLILSLLSKRLHKVILNGKALQEYHVGDGVSEGSILDLTLSPLYSNDISEDAQRNITYIC